MYPIDGSKYKEKKEKANKIFQNGNRMQLFRKILPAAKFRKYPTKHFQSPIIWNNQHGIVADININTMSHAKRSKYHE
jgi:hypothetical protein